MNSLTPSFPSQPLQRDVDNFVGAALAGNDLALTKLLEKYGSAIIDRKHRHGWTALMAAATYGQKPIIETLLENGASPNEKGSNGRTALIYAAQNGKVSIVRRLLEKGATLDDKDNAGKTALMCAKESGHTAVIELLQRRIDEQDRLLQEEQRAQFLKDTDFSKGLEKPIPKPHPFNIYRPKP